MKITEAQLSRLVSDFLTLDGWRVLKQEPLSRAGGGRYAGEMGMPDLLCLRYEFNRLAAGIRPILLPEICHFEAQVFWIEVKRLGAKPKPHQLAWHERERALGAEVWVIDDFDAFKAKYLESGLNRNIRS